MGQAFHEQRQSTRFSVMLPARCRSRSGFVDHVVIGDLSAHGCRIQSSGLILSVGQLVVVRPEGLEGLCGRICWVDGHVAGIAFDQPLYQPVVEHLQRRHAHYLNSPALDPGMAYRRAA